MQGITILKPASYRLYLCCVLGKGFWHNNVSFIGKRRDLIECPSTLLILLMKMTFQILARPLTCVPSITCEIGLEGIPLFSSL